MSGVLIFFLYFFFLVEVTITSRVRVLARKPSPPAHSRTDSPRLLRLAAITKENPKTILGIALSPFCPELQGLPGTRPGGAGDIHRLRKIGDAPQSASAF